MADSATAKKLTRPGALFTRRYGLAFAAVSGARLLDLLFHHFNLPHTFAAFAQSAIAITFWYGGTKPGIVAVLLSSLIRSFIVEREASRHRPCTPAETFVFRIRSVMLICAGPSVASAGVTRLMIPKNTDWNSHWLPTQGF